jgi:hypothetical protein
VWARMSSFDGVIRRSRSQGEPGANLNFTGRERQARCEKGHEPHAPCRPPERQLLSEDETSRRARTMAHPIWSQRCAPKARITSGGRIHPDRMSIGLVADEGYGRVTDRVEAS